MSKLFEICLLLTVISNYPVKVSLKLTSMNPDISCKIHLIWAQTSLTGFDLIQHNNHSCFQTSLNFHFFCVNSMIEQMIRCVPCWGGIQQVHWDLVLEHYVYLIQNLPAIRIVNLWVLGSRFTPGLSEDITIKHYMIRQNTLQSLAQMISYRTYMVYYESVFIEGTLYGCDRNSLCIRDKYYAFKL